jgi:hypothetical protein
VRSHLETLWAEREQLVDEIARLGLVHDRPLVKGGRQVATDLVANPLLRELRAIDELIVKLGSPADEESNPFARFAAG